MRLPRWFPAVPRPFNPAYRSTWDAMSHEDRQWSFLTDCIVCTPAVLVVLFGGTWNDKALLVLIFLLVVRVSKRR